MDVLFGFLSVVNFRSQGHILSSAPFHDDVRSVEHRCSIYLFPDDMHLMYDNFPELCTIF